MYGAEPRSPKSPKSPRSGVLSSERSDAGSSTGNESDDVKNLGPAQTQVRNIVHHIVFDAAMSAVIAIGALSLGIEQFFRFNGMGTLPFQIISSICLCVFILELSLRAFASGWDWWQNWWLLFDASVVFTGILAQWILDPALDDFPNSSGFFVVLHCFRVLQVLKIVRPLARVKQLSILLGGLFRCAPLVIYTLAVFLCCFYSLAWLGVEVIAGHALNDEDPHFHEHAAKHFGSLPRALVTLLRFACLDNTSEVYSLLVDKDPWLAIYFVTLMVLLSLVLFHVLGAVVFTSTMDHNQREAEYDLRKQERKWTKLIVKLRDMFTRMDADQSGRLSRAEVMQINHQDMKLLCDALGVKEPMEVFNALDVDKSGEISIDEFFDGVRDLIIGKGVEVSAKRTERQVETIHWRLKEMFAMQHEMSLEVQKFGKELSIIRGLCEYRREEDLFAPRVGSRGSPKANSDDALFAPRANAKGMRIYQDFSAAKVSPDVSPGPSPTIPSKPLATEEFPGWAHDLAAKLQQSVDSMLGQTQELTDKLRSGLQENLTEIGKAVEKSNANAAVKPEGFERQKSNGSSNSLKLRPPPLTKMQMDNGRAMQMTKHHGSEQSAVASTQQVRLPEISG